MNIKKRIVSITIACITLILITFMIYFFQESRLISCADYKNINIDFATVEISDKDIDDNIADIKSSYSTLQTVNRSTINSGDVVTLDCLIFKDNLEVKSISKFDVMVGTYNFNREVEDFIIDKRIGETLTLSTNGLKYELFVYEIKEFVFPGFTKEFLAENFNVYNYDEFRNQIKETLYDQKNFEAKNNAKNSIVRDIVNRSHFYIKRNDIVEQYRKTLEYYTSSAKLYNLTLEEYILQIENADVETFSKKCYNESIYTIKKDLVIQYIWKNLDEKQRLDLLIEYGITNPESNNISKEEQQQIVYNYLFDLAIKNK